MKARSGEMFVDAGRALTDTVSALVPPVPRVRSLAPQPLPLRGEPAAGALECGITATGPGGPGHIPAIGHPAIRRLASASGPCQHHALLCAALRETGRAFVVKTQDHR